MSGKKKLMLIVFITFFAFVFNMDNVFAEKFYPDSSISGLKNEGSDKYSLSCDDVTATITILSVERNNEQKSDCNGAGVFWDATDSSRIKNLTQKLNKGDQNNHFVLWAHSITNGTTDKITLEINNSCKGTIQVRPYDDYGWTGKYHEANASVKFELDITSNKTEVEKNFKTKVTFGVKKYQFNDGDDAGNYFMEFEGTTETVAEKMTEYSKTGDENAKKEAIEEMEKHATEGGTYIQSGKQIASTTGSASIGAGESQKLECDESLSSFIKEIWKYFIIFAPILLIVMVTMDFFKALFSSDADLLKKASSNAIKRVVATVILLFLPLVISTILDFFGLELCLWGGK